MIAVFVTELGGGLDPPLNHQITNKKWLKSPYHQQKMAQITITKSPLRSPITNKKASNHQIFFDAQTKVSTKKMMPLFKSPTKMAQITKN